LNDRYAGPIRTSQGKPPTVERAALITWWKDLEKIQEEIERRDRDTKATVGQVYDSGKPAQSVAPQISGTVKKRKRRG
jgi:hypothetical protein